MTDVIVVGGGSVGMLAALLLARSGAQVTLFSPDAPSLHGAATTQRCLALTPPTVATIRALGITDAALTTIGRMVISDGDWHSHALSFDAATLGVAALGAIIREAPLLGALRAQLPIQRVRVVTEQVVAMAVQEKQVNCATANGTRYSASLLIGADGARSWVRGQLGVPMRQHNYGEQALMTTICGQNASSLTAYQRFSNGKPLALLPTDGGEHAVVWTLPATEADYWREVPDELFVAAIEREMGAIVGKTALTSGRFCVPLVRRLVAHTVAHRVVLLGDAAAGVHPLAGQGFNLATLDAMALADAVSSARRAGVDIGTRATLLPTMRRRYADLRMAQHLFDAIRLAYRDDVPLLRRLRHTALPLLHSAAMQRRLFDYISAA